MRPGQNKRMRGRNRRGPNPLTRSFESNGPDVKVRGTAQHVAEKYTQLARDAHLAGDPVAAESYLQHAEHYFRIIAAAFQAQQAVQNGTVEDREDDDDEDFDTSSDRFTFRTPQTIHQAQQGGQPGNGQPGEFGEGEDAPRGDGEDGSQGERPQPEPRPQFNRNNRDDRRGGRGQERNFRPRNDQGERFGGDRQSHDRQGQDRQGSERFSNDRFNNERPRRPAPEAEIGAEQPGLPAFLTAPVRPQVADTVPVSNEPFAEGGDEAGNFRNRRRRRGRSIRGPDEGGPEVDVPGGEVV